MSLLGNGVFFSPSVEFLLGGCVADTAGERSEPAPAIDLFDGWEFTHNPRINK